MTEFTLRSNQPAVGTIPEQSRLFAGHPVLDRPFARKAVFAVAGTALIALCAHISLPLGFTPVPFTLQPFAILLLGLLLSPATAFATLILYLAEGAMGLPVFSPHGPGGTAQLLGPTGGYLMAAPIAAAVTSLLSRFRGGMLARFVSAAVGDATLLFGGAAWLGLYTHSTFRAVASLAILPFVLSDTIKALAAAACAGILQSFRKSPVRPDLSRSH